MKQYQLALAVFLLAAFGPLILLSRCEKVKSPPASETTPIKTDSNREIAVLQGEEIVKMPLEDYVVSVVLSEMPARFSEEALKAQAVVARTYALRHEEKGKKHKPAAVCVNSGCCQGYISVEDYLAKGGKKESVEKINKAVEGTKDVVLMYEGKLIDATYFSCSGGMTEDAVAVWGADVPYLQSTESPGEETATHYSDTVQFTKESFCRKIGLYAGDATTIRVEDIQYTEGGGVDCLKINGKKLKGTKIRKLLGLRSTAFSITVQEDTVTVTTKGYGHRVGMSQYGAQAMALEGKTFEEILLHYYAGVTLSQIPGED